MNLYNVIWESFSFKDKPIEELIDISSLVDEGKNNSEVLMDNKEEGAQIAGMIVAFMNEKSTADVGNKLYNDINKLIVSKNLVIVNEKNGKELYDKLMNEQTVGKYTIHRHSKGYSFALKAPSGEVLALSELYSKVESCLLGIEAVRKNSSGKIEDQTKEDNNRVLNPKFEIFVDKKGEYRFRLKAKNGEILATSEGYKSKQSCFNAIELVKQNAVSNNIEKA